MNRHTRYQGLVVQNHHVLLIRLKEHATGHTFWVIPGGGRTDNETEEECVIRELFEETNLHVRVERLLFDDPVPPGETYQRLKTYLCTPVGGEARPGCEPEPEAAGFAITAVRWFDLRDETSWEESLKTDSFTYLMLVRLRNYLVHESEH